MKRSYFLVVLLAIGASAWADVLPLDDSSLSDVAGVDSNGIFNRRTDAADARKAEEIVADLRESLRKASVNGAENAINPNSVPIDQPFNYDANRDAPRDVVAGQGGSGQLSVRSGQTSLGSAGISNVDYSGSHARVIYNSHN